MDWSFLKDHYVFARWLLAFILLVSAYGLKEFISSLRKRQATNKGSVAAVKSFSGMKFWADSQPPESFIELMMMSPLSDFRQVAIRFVTGSCATHIVHKNHLESMVAACIELHGSPGRNPHTKGTTCQADEISVSFPEMGGPYWWSTSGLMDNYDYEKGAGVVDFSGTVVRWSRQQNEGKVVCMAAAIDPTCAHEDLLDSLR